MSHRFFAIPLLALSLLNTGAMAQDASRDSIAQRVNRAIHYNYYNPQEKVFLHFDNTSYYMGETIHFKAYVTRTDSRRLSDLSHVLYVDLMTPEGEVFASRKLKIEDGMAWGDFELNELLTTGYYEIRAYTRYMVNWGPNACFSRVFPIFRQPKQPGDYAHPVIAKRTFRNRVPNQRESTFADDTLNTRLSSVNHHRGLSVNFYPEGGNLVEGLPSRMAYTVIDNGREVRRAILDVTPVKGGRLSADFDKTDSVVVIRQDAGGRYRLPEVQQEGVTLTLDVERDDSVMVRLHATPKYYKTTLGYSLVYNGAVRKASIVQIGDDTVLRFARTALDKGVSQLTLFDADGKILAERLFFVPPMLTSADSVRVTTETKVIKPCGKTSFTLQTQPFSYLSFAAVDAATMAHHGAGSFRSNLLLGSDVRGYIANPDYYFESDDLEHRKAADLLMLVQGWRRYDWREMTDTVKTMRQQPLEVDLSIFGYLRPKRRRQHVDQTNVHATMYNKEGYVYDGDFVTQKDGFYRFQMPDVKDEWTLFLRCQQEEKNANFTVTIDRQFAPSPRFVAPEEADDSDAPKPQFLWREDSGEVEASDGIIRSSNYLLDEVVVKHRAINGYNMYEDETDARLSSFAYYNCDEASEAIVDKGEDMPGFVEWLRKKSDSFDGEETPTDITSVETLYDSAFVYYRDGLTINGRPVIWIIDNFYFALTGFTYPLKTISVLELNRTDTRVEFPALLSEVRNIYISDDRDILHRYMICEEVEARNPMVLYCFTHRLVPLKQKGVRSTHFQGFNVPKTFQMDNYDYLPPMEDFRRTLYWEPDLRTDGEGRAVVEFFNNSSCKEMYISVEGITPNGLPLGY